MVFLRSLFGVIFQIQKILTCSPTPLLCLSAPSCGMSGIVTTRASAAGIPII
ncbi:hypothetical protein THTE_3064 [Thermogutta terrifontis]|uniref:Uncharacterized protein n=1 Tax=Thermogutta terrifontis TaxID=1331910 RepID=A0A286RI98_9BACT|nr:hypothetical protein THTE_3064 [Thermogutta terrifontis]